MAEQNGDLKPLPQWGRRYNSDSQTDSPWARKVILSLGMKRRGSRAHLQCSHTDCIIVYRRRWSQRLLVFAHPGAIDGRDQEV